MRRHRKNEGRWKRSHEGLFWEAELCFSRDRKAAALAFFIKGILLKGRVLKSHSSFPAPGPRGPGLAGQCLLRYPGMEVSPLSNEPRGSGLPLKPWQVKERLQAQSDHWGQTSPSNSLSSKPGASHWAPRAASHPHPATSWESQVKSQLYPKEIK